MGSTEHHRGALRARRTFPRRRVGPGVCLLFALSVLPLQAGEGGCPPPETMQARLAALRLERGARTARFEMPPPTDLYEKAGREPGKSFTMRVGDKGEGVIVAEVPVLALWKALNDENHHADEGSPIPVEYSEVIDGTPRGESRMLFQWAKKFGFGRWWVSHVWMNGELYKASDGQLWELLWEGKSDEADPDAPPMKSVSSDLKPVKQSAGAWLLVPLAESCTLVEYFNWTDPGGGMVGFTQPMVFKKGLNQTVSGVVELSAKYRTGSHPGPPFLLPDGTPLD